MVRDNAWPPLVPTLQGEIIAATGTELMQRGRDPYQLHGSDHPGLCLVTALLTGKNYLPWSHSMLLAFGAKTKIGFIDGTIKMPELESAEYHKWKKIDCMMISWILNSLSKEVCEGFIYAKSTYNLWKDLKDRFGESNGPLMYQLKKEIRSLTQGNIELSVYFTKLKRFWDEYDLLAPTVLCDCRVATQNYENKMNDRLIDFLMGLNDNFEHVRSQILLMDPLPSINKAYSLLQKPRIEHGTSNASNSSARAAINYFQWIPFILKFPCLHRFY